MTMAKKFTSCSGMRSYIRSKARDSGTPIFCCSTRSMNSPFTGSGISVAMICKQSEIGRPDLMPRTMMSMALANSMRNLA